MARHNGRLIRNVRGSTVDAMTTVRLHILAAVALCAILSATRAEASAIAQFRDAYRTLALADQARDDGHWSEAVSIFEQAHEMYRSLSRKYPDWQPSVVRFRVSYCASQIRALQKRLAADRDGRTAPRRRAPTPAPAGERGMAGLVGTARGLMDDGDPLRARALLLDGLRLDPDDGTVRLLLAVSQCQAGNHEDAVYLLKPLIEEDPGNAPAHVVLGAAYFGLGGLAEAAKEMGRAIALRPRLAEAHFNLAQVYLAMDPPLDAEAQEAYRRALGLGAPADSDVEARLR